MLRISKEQGSGERPVGWECLALTRGSRGQRVEGQHLPQVSAGSPYIWSLRQVFTGSHRQGEN